jgi:hypothetical protein
MAPRPNQQRGTLADQRDAKREAQKIEGTWMKLLTKKHRGAPNSFKDTLFDATLTL